MSKPRAVVAEFDDVVDYRVGWPNDAVCYRAVNRFHTGREEFPLDEDLSPIRRPEWDHASRLVRATQGVAVRVRVWSDGRIELIPRCNGDNTCKQSD